MIDFGTWKWSSFLKWRKRVWRRQHVKFSQTWFWPVKTYFSVMASAENNERTCKLCSDFSFMFCNTFYFVYTVFWEWLILYMMAVLWCPGDIELTSWKWLWWFFFSDSLYLYTLLVTQFHSMVFYFLGTLKAWRQQKPWRYPIHICCPCWVAWHTFGVSYEEDMTNGVSHVFFIISGPPAIWKN